MERPKCSNCGNRTWFVVCKKCGYEEKWDDMKNNIGALNLKIQLMAFYVPTQKMKEINDKVNRACRNVMAETAKSRKSDNRRNSGLPLD